MTTAANDFTFRDLYRSLDERKRPEEIALMILAVGEPPAEVERALLAAADRAGSYS